MYKLSSWRISIYPVCQNKPEQLITYRIVCHYGKSPWIRTVSKLVFYAQWTRTVSKLVFYAQWTKTVSKLVFYAQWTRTTDNILHRLFVPYVQHVVRRICMAHSSEIYLKNILVMVLFVVLFCFVLFGEGFCSCCCCCLFVCVLFCLFVRFLLFLF